MTCVYRITQYRAPSMFFFDSFAWTGWMMLLLYDHQLTSMTHSPPILELAFCSVLKWVKTGLLSPLEKR